MKLNVVLSGVHTSKWTCDFPDISRFVGVGNSIPANASAEYFKILSLPIAKFSSKVPFDQLALKVDTETSVYALL